ncbi:hypothetical protein KYB31_15615 [Clostridium felsineum]|uniref:hypothetical protein n=1 Tax=Clostridium felsineum TaxID=36839 RepID=UPI00214D3140|nr:hypothetical protein [Clostridium felsineum]MCR3760405.1 hypothetical protein [Clostridium felsineum]
MTLDEAIKHCYSKIKEETKCKNDKCADEHLQLAHWLEELRGRRKRDSRKS